MQHRGMVADGRRQWSHIVVDCFDDTDDDMRKLAVQLASFRATQRMALSTSDVSPQPLLLWTLLELLFPEVRHQLWHMPTHLRLHVACS